MHEYDLVIIGSGPAGEKAALTASVIGKKVAIVECRDLLGGTVLTGGLPLKALKEIASSYQHSSHALSLTEQELSNHDIINNLNEIKDLIVSDHTKEVRSMLNTINIDIFKGTASFTGTHTIHISGELEVDLKGANIIIATGVKPFHPPEYDFSSESIHDVLSISLMKRLPKSMAIIGAGPVGCEFATIFSLMGVKVYLINRSNNILPFVDREIVAKLLQYMDEHSIKLLSNRSVISTNQNPEGNVCLQLSSEEKLNVDMVLYTASRRGNIENLNLDQIGIQYNENGLITTNEYYQTSIDHIYAVGDVIGFPSLASTSMDQGRAAVTHMYNIDYLRRIGKVIPYGIYTIPEISSAGVTEEEAKRLGLDYQTCKSRYIDLPRGKIMNDHIGMLKLIYTKDDLVIRGVHIIGTLATEIINHGVELIEHKMTLFNIAERVYNFPTIHELYKRAALEGLAYSKSNYDYSKERDDYMKGLSS